MRTELLPCPFCGGDARLATRSEILIYCAKCGIQTAEHSRKETAVEVWSRRAVPILNEPSGDSGQLHPSAQPAVAWSIVFDEQCGVNAQTTFSTESRANEYADRAAIPDACDAGPKRARVVPLYAAPTLRPITDADIASISEAAYGSEARKHAVRAALEYLLPHGVPVVSGPGIAGTTGVAL